MILQLQDCEDDDPEFVAIVELVVRGVSGFHKPRQFQVFRINNWFGPKWLGFCARVVGAAGFRNFTNVVVPPFVQNRLTAQSLFVCRPDGQYEYSGDGPQIHHVGKSSENFKNLVRVRTPETMLFWFSGNTKKNKRGSLMAYMPGRSDGMWYLEFQKQEEWSISQQIDFPPAINELIRSSLTLDKSTT